MQLKSAGQCRGQMHRIVEDTKRGRKVGKMLKPQGKKRGQCEMKTELKRSLAHWERDARLLPQTSLHNFKNISYLSFYG
jgi:hypothetical protein